MNPAVTAANLLLLQEGILSLMPAAPVYGMTSGRIAPSITALIAVAAVVAGGIAFARRRHGARRTAMTTVVLGTATAATGAFLALTSGGAPGTGNGIVASVGAVVLGSAAVALGWTGVRSRAARQLDA